MKKSTIFIAFLAVIILGYLTFFYQNENSSPQEKSDPLTAIKNTEYTIEGEVFKLIDGYSEKEVAPASATKIITQTFGEPFFGDLDDDGDEDALIFITHDPGGSGTFFYLAGAINQDGTYQGTNAILLGDRIQTGNIENKQGIAKVNYFDREMNEPMTAIPTIERIRYFSLKENNLIENASTQNDLIFLIQPTPDSYVSSPLTIKGQARGNWFFEGDFPLILTDWDGKIIAEGYATADGEWMTTDFVPFEGTLKFTKPDYGERGALILRKDNPSGLPENDDALEITIFFE